MMNDQASLAAPATPTHRKSLWQLTTAGWGHCGLAWISAGMLPEPLHALTPHLPRRDQYSGRRTSLVLYTLAYRKGLAPSHAVPPMQDVCWWNQPWHTSDG